MSASRRLFCFLVGSGLTFVGALSALAVAPPYDQNDGRLIYGKKVAATSSDEALEAYWDDDDASAGIPLGQFLGTSTLLDIDGAANATDNLIRHVRIANSPKGKEAVAGIQYRQSTGMANLNVYGFDGSSWALGYTVLSVANSNEQRAFDVAYELRSGQALVVAGDDTMANPRSPRYRTFTQNATTGVWEWSAMATVPMNLGAGFPRWVQLYSKPGTDEILMLVLSSASELHSILWTGTGWQPLSGPTGTSMIEDSVTHTPNKNFDGAWIANSGSGQRRFLAVYRDTSSNDGAVQPNESNAMHFRMLVNTTWQGEKALQYANPSATNPPDVISMASDLAGERVVLVGYLQTNLRVMAGVWENGRAGCSAGDEPACWYGVTTITNCGAIACMWSGALPLVDTSVKTTTLDGGTFPIGVGWAGSGAAQTAVVVYTDNPSTSAGLDYATWTAGTWTYDLDLGGTGSNGEELSFVVKSFLSDTNRLMVVYADAALSVYEAMFDVAASPQWSVKNFSGLSIPEDKGTPFDFQSNRFVVPKITLNPSPFQLPIRSSGASGGPSILIEDPAGIVYNEAPESAGDEGITDRDLVIGSPIPWTASATCLPVNAPLPPATSAAGKLTSGGSCGASAAAVSSLERALDVTADFAAGDAMLVYLWDASSLGRLNTVGQTAGGPAPFTLKSNVRPDATAGTDWDVTSTSTGTVQLVQSLELSDPSPLLGNSFLVSAVQQGTQPADLLKFKLTAVGGDVEVQKLTFNLTPTGSTNITFDGFSLTCAAAVTFSPAPPASLAVAGPTTLTLYPSNLTVAGTSPQTCTLSATATGNSLNSGEEVTVLLGPTSSADITARGAAPVSVPNLQDIYPDTLFDGSAADAIRRGSAAWPQSRHTYSTYTIALSGADFNVSQQIAIGRTLTITWTKFNVNNPTAIDYSLDGSSWSPTGCSLTTSPCNWTILPTIAASAVNQARIRIQGTELSTGQAISATLGGFTITEALELGNASALQLDPSIKAQNALRKNPLTDVDIFRFKLRPLGGSVTVNPLRATLTLGGISLTEVTNIKLVRISDGTVLKNFTPSATTLDFGSVAVTGETDFVIRASLAATLTDGNAGNGELVGGEQLGASLDLAGLVAATGSVTATVDLKTVPSAVRAGSPALVSPVAHTRPGYQSIVVTPVGSTQVLAGRNATVGWTATGGADASVDAITFEFYQSGFGTPVSQTVNLTSGDTNPYSWSVPTASSVSSAAQACVRERAPYEHIRGCSSAFSVLERLELKDHASGQLSPVVTDADNALKQAAITDLGLLRFRLGAVGGPATVETLRFGLSLQGLVPTTDFVLRLMTPGGPVTPTGFNATMVEFSDVDVATQNDAFTLQISVSKALTGGESIQASLALGGLVSVRGNTSNVVLTGVAGAVGDGAPVLVSPVTHTRPGFQFVSPAGGAIGEVGQPLPIEWSLLGAPNPNVTIQFFRHAADASPSHTVAAGVLASPLAPAWTVLVANTVSTDAVLCIRETSATYAHIQRCSAAFAVREGLTLSDHSADQLQNNIFATAPMNVPVFRFRLAPQGVGSGAEISSLSVALSGVSGITASQITGVRLNGAAGTVIGGPVPTAFQFGPLTVTSPTDVVVEADFSQLDAGDAITLDLPAGNVTAAGQAPTAGSGLVLVTRVTTLTPASHVVPTRFIRTPAPNAVLRVDEGLTMEWVLKDSASVNIWLAPTGDAPSSGVSLGSGVANDIGGGLNTLPIVVPDLISTTLTLTVVDTADPLIETSIPVQVGARFTFTSPVANDRWAVQDPARSIAWATAGSGVTARLEFVPETSPGVFGTPIVISDPTWSALDLLVAAGQNPQADRDLRGKLRLTDIAGGAHPAVSDESGLFTLFYYGLLWEVKDQDRGYFLDGLSVNEVVTGWGQSALFAPVPRNYPYLTNLSTSWFRSDYTAATVDWGIDNGNSLIQWDPGLETGRIEALLKSTFVIPLKWEPQSSFDYQPATNQVNVTAWLKPLENGLILDPGLLQGVQVDLFDQAGTPLAPLAPGVSPDSEGIYRFPWTPGVLADDQTFFAKVRITYDGVVYTSLGVQNFTVRKKLEDIANQPPGGGGSGGVTLAELQNELAPIGTGVNNIQGIVTPLGQQITDAQGAIQADIATSQAAVEAKVDSAQAAIQTDLSVARTSIEGKIDGVQTYLSDPDAGLPKVLDQQKAMRRGGILNRDMSVDQGDSATIRYRSVDDAVAPTIIIIDPLSGSSSFLMSQVSPNLYEYVLPAAALGEYKVTVSEPASADSAGTLDSIIVTARAATATATAVSGLGTQLTDLSTQLTTVEQNLDAHLTAIEGAMATKTQVDGLIISVDTLVTKWGALSAQDLMNELMLLQGQIGGLATNADMQTALGQLGTIQTDMAKDATVAKSVELAGLATQASVDGLDAKLGTPTSGTIAGDIAAIPGAINYTARFDGIDTAVLNLQNVVNTIETDMAKDATVAKTTDLAGLARTIDLDPLAKEASLTGLARTTDLDPLARSAELAGLAREATMQGRFDILDTALASLATQVGTPAQQASVDALALTADAIQAGMARDADLQSALTRLDTLQTGLTGLDTKLGTPAFGSVSADVADLKADIAAIPGSINYTTRFDAVDAALGAMATQIGDPAQRAMLDGAIAQLNTIQTDMAKDADLQTVKTDVTGVASTLTALDARVGTPAQQASLDAAIAALGTIQTDMAQETSVQSVVAAVGNLQTSLTALTAAVGTPAQDAALAAVDGKIDAVQAAIAALPGPIDYSPQLTALQGGVDSLATTMGAPATGSLAGDIAAIPGAVDYTPMLTTLQADLTVLAGTVNDPAQAVKLQEALDALTTIGGQVAALSGSGAADLTPVNDALAALSTAVGQLKTDVAALPTETADGETLLTKLAELQSTVESAAGSGAAVGLSQSAYVAASEAVKILQQIQTQLQAGQPGQGPALLGEVGEKLKSISSSITLIPGEVSSDELSEQVKELAKRAQGVASERGYRFDSLYEIAENQSTDVKTMRNQVQELKQLLELQRAILEQNMNQPVMKTWFEAQ